MAKAKVINEPIPNRIYDAEVLSIIDGDTARLKIILEKSEKDLGFYFFTKTEKWFIHNFRLNGIDTAELRSKDPEERKRAQLAKKYLEDEIASVNKILKVETKKNDEEDKYGRYLVTLFINNRNLNQELIEKGLAKPYFGGKK